jgi:hypothetical protein
VANASGDGDTAASVTSLKIVNGSDWRIDEMYLREAGQADWGPEQLGANITISASGGQHTLTDIACGKYDVRLVDELGDECVVPDQNFCQTDVAWEFSNASLLKCQGRVAP